ncbi:EamA family transporter [Alicyclobacillus fructus]|uniref:EamA family transporter n=1 Tax=Alicyclobacillus fructus TaxID=2816082 RepID=UPI001F412838|nr:EamA family transporter [Alicyclobacillus fructus]
MLRISEVWAARALLVFVTLIWGATFTLTQQALAVLNPYAFLSLRFAAAAIAMSALGAGTPIADANRADVHD